MFCICLRICCLSASFLLAYFLSFPSLPPVTLLWFGFHNLLIVISQASSFTWIPLIIYGINVHCGCALVLRPLACSGTKKVCKRHYSFFPKPMLVSFLLKITNFSMAFKIMGFIMAFYTHTNSLLICFPLFPFSLPSFLCGSSSSLQIFSSCSCMYAQICILSSACKRRHAIFFLFLSLNFPLALHLLGFLPSSKLSPLYFHNLYNTLRWIRER